MKTLKTIAALVALAALAPSVDAKMARRDVRTVRQPDGTEIRVKLVGDEYMHFTLAEDGTLLHEDQNGLYTYGAVADDGRVVSTGVAVSKDSRLTANTVNISDLNLADMAEKRGVAQRMAQTVPGAFISESAHSRAPQSGYGLSASTYPRTGSPKGLIILVRYQDVDFTLSDPKAYFDDMINGENFTQYSGTGSALAYFREQSGGKFVPSFDVLGPVTLPHPMNYYGGNDNWGNDKNPHLMVTHAIDILDPTVDFSKYDTDGDGIIDNVYVFYAGAGEADGGSANTVWPHSWDVRDGGVRKSVDNVMVGHYACSNEWSTYDRKPDGIGTFVHEFSHVMGLPDLYHTTSSSAYYTPDNYSVMDYGCYNNSSRTPPFYTAYERNAMSWFEPILLTKEANVRLDNIGTGQFALIPTSKNTEFFLLENRQTVGWDKYIDGHGMLIWHIDYNKSVFDGNRVNNTQSHQYVDIVEANNKPNSSQKSNKAGWPFPGTSNKTEFTASTTPALEDWSGTPIDLPITDITEAGGIITFKVKGGAITLDTPVPTHTVDNTGRSFTATWPAVEGATDYYITVIAKGKGESGEVRTGFDGSSVSNGWKASKTGWYTSSGNYGKASPSYKFDTNGQTLTSPEIAGAARHLEFWAKGQTTLETTLSIEGLIGGVWKEVAVYTPVLNTAQTASYDLPDGVEQIRFTLNKKTGNIAIDDIVISYGEGNQVLPDYNDVSTNGQTTFKVDKLKDGIDEYYYYVQAADDTTQRSYQSETMFVDLNDPSAGIDGIVTDEDSPVEYFNLQGIRVDTPAAGTVVIERRGSMVRKVIIR